MDDGSSRSKVRLRLVQERIRHNWSQRELAKRLGTTVVTVSRWERGLNEPTGYFRQKLMDLFGKSAEELGFFETEPAPVSPLPAAIPPVLPSVDVPSPAAIEPMQQHAPVVTVKEVTRPVPSVQREKNLARMLELVSRIWITDLLEKSLHGATLLTLGLYEQPDVVKNPWRLVWQDQDRPAEMLPEGTSVAQIYDATNGHLLILGEPGSGKTTLLLELTRDLLQRAEQDATLAVPVVFNLSSWVMKRRPLDEWLVAELHDKYQVPLALAKRWVGTDAIIPLLDGLDEVAAAYRSACVDALNDYRNKHGLVPVVICCRYRDYLEQSGRLLLRSAVVLQPLTSEHVQTYLATFGSQVDGLRFALSEDKDLQELATTPLMLNILTLTYQDAKQEDVFSAGTIETRRRQIFALYVKRMLQRRSKQQQHYSADQTVYWLASLARQMKARQETEFYIEHLQFNWLPDGLFRRILPRLSIGLTQGLLVGLVFAALIGIFHGVRSGLLIGGTLALWNTGLCCLLNGIVPGWFDGSELREEREPEQRSLHAFISPLVDNRIVYGLIYAFLNMPLISLLFSLFNDLHMALLEQVLYGTIYAFLFGCAFCFLGRIPLQIQPTEMVNWSRQNVRRNAVRYVLIAMLAGALQGLIYPLVMSITLVLSLGFLALLVSGISNNALEQRQRLRPNQGIRRSVRNSWLMGLVAGGGMWLFTFCFIGYFLGAYTGFLYGIVPGLVLGLALAMQRGGAAVILHTVLRWSLWWEGTLPWNVPLFLDEAAERILLQKVGGGYRFIHRLLLEYFAQLEPSPAETALIISTQQRVSRRWILSGSAVLAAVGTLALLELTDLIPAPLGALLSAYTKHHAAVNSLAFSPNGALIASGGDDKTIRICDATTGADRVVVPVGRAITALSWSKDLSLLAVGQDNGYVQIWQISGSAVRQMYQTQMYTGPIRSLQWSASGHSLATISHDGRLHLWDPVAYSHPRMLQCYLSEYSRDALSWSPHRPLLAFMQNEQHLQIWDAEQMRMSGTIAFPHAISNLAWSPRGDAIVVCSPEGKISLWNITQKALQFKELGDFVHIYCLSWSPDGDYLVIGGESGCADLGYAYRGGVTELL